MKNLLQKSGDVIAWFGTWVLLMVAGLSWFYHPEPLWVANGISVVVQPVCLILLGLVLKYGIAPNLPSIQKSSQ